MSTLVRLYTQDCEMWGKKVLNVPLVSAAHGFNGDAMTIVLSAFFPEVYGYMMASDPEDTNKGVKVTLNRLDTPALHGMQPFNNVTVEVEFHTDNRLRIKVDL